MDLNELDKILKGKTISEKQNILCKIRLNWEINNIASLIGKRFYKNETTRLHNIVTQID